MSDREAKNIVSDNSEKKWLLTHEFKAIFDCAKKRTAFGCHFVGAQAGKQADRPYHLLRLNTAIATFGY